MAFYPTMSVNVRESTALASIASLSRVAIMSPHCFTLETSTPIYDISGADFLPTDSDAYKALQAGFKGAGSRTLPLYLSRVAMDDVTFTPVVANLEEYSFKATVYDTTDMSKTLDAVEVSFTSDADATDDEIVAGIIAEMTTQGITPADLVVTDNTTTFAITEATDRQLVLSEVSSNLQLAFTTSQTGAEAFNALMDENSEDWYRLTTTSRDTDFILELADVIEATESSDTPKIFRVSSAAIETLSAQTDPSNTNDLLGRLEDGNYKRTTAEWHDQSAEIFPEVTHEAYVGSFQEGTKGTAFNQNMSVPAARHPVLGRTLTKSEVGFITDRNATTRFTEFGLVITKTGKNGTSARGQGQWIQNVVIADWTKLTMIQRGLTLLVNSDNAGDPITFARGRMLAVADTLNSVLVDGVNSGLFTGFVPVEVPESVAFSDQAMRTLSGLKFTAYLAGAVNFVIVDGVLTYAEEVQ